ncbi:hypothetical protein Tco_1520181 [Tanacetum coccineum]
MRLASRCSRLRWQRFEIMTVGVKHRWQRLSESREMGNMQAELLALRGQHRRARQPGSDARAPDHQEATRDADSHI